MATIASPYGLKPVQLIGGQAFSGGTIREVPMTTNSAVGVFSGDTVVLVGGTALAGTVTPTTTVGATSTPVGVCVGVRYTDPVMKQTLYAQYLPANAITNGYTNVFIRVVDDPDCLFQVQADATTTYAAAVGRNTALTGFSAGSTTTGNSGVKASVAGLAATATLAVRVVDVIDSGAAFPDLIVKFNAGVHAYNLGTGQ